MDWSMQGIPIMCAIMALFEHKYCLNKAMHEPSKRKEGGQYDGGVLLNVSSFKNKVKKTRIQYFLINAHCNINNMNY